MSKLLAFADAADCLDAWKIALKEWNVIESRQVKEWKDEARRESRVEDLINILQDKFGNLPTEIPSHLQKIDDAKVLSQLLLRAVHASDLAEFQRMIPNGTK